jgi:fatty-acyl-CoA synthase
MNPPAVIEGAVERLGLKTLLPVYGMTETTSVTTFPRPTDPREVILAGKGVLVSDFELKLEDGEICVRGHCVMQGYYKDPEATAAAIDADGWFHTGDLGALDGAGYLSVTGRKSDMFIVGGSNAYPAEIERLMSQHPAVKQAYVVGVPDERLGEVGFAFVERRAGAGATADEIVAHCAATMADYKVPRYVRFVEEWPLTSSGKIQRFRLQEEARAATSTSSRRPARGRPRPAAR